MDFTVNEVVSILVAIVIVAGVFLYNKSRDKKKEYEGTPGKKPGNNIDREK